MTYDRLNLCPACGKEWKPRHDAVCRSCRDAGRQDPNRATVPEILLWFVTAIISALGMAIAAHKLGWLP